MNNNPQATTENSPKSEKGLTDKQIKFALETRKPMFIKNTQEMIDFLSSINEPQWWLDRKNFLECAKSFNEIKKYEYYVNNPEKLPVEGSRRYRKPQNQAEGNQQSQVTPPLSQSPAPDSGNLQAPSLSGTVETHNQQAQNGVSI